MLSVLFVVLVLVGFIFWFLATWPVPYAERVARGCFLAACLIWALGRVGT